jgi:hypothetical protein
VNHYLLKTLDFGPIVLERIVAQVPASRLDERSDPDRFTIREVAAHLADWEPILRGRFQQMLDEPGSFLEPRDEGQLAIDNRYSELDVAESLRRFMDERAVTSGMLRGLAPEQWEKFGVHREVGHMTVSDLANMMLGHDMYHLEHASGFMEG